MALINDMDPDNTGAIRFAQFKAWVNNPNTNPNVSFQGDLTLSELKTKAYRCINLLQKKGILVVSIVMYTMLTRV